MTVEIVTISCLSDNYVYLVRSGDMTAVVDAPESEPVAAELRSRGWGLDEIWITHHHADHIDGVGALVDEFGASVTGHAADAQRLPPLDRALADGDTFEFAGQQVEMFDVSGHTIGHVAYHMPGAKAAFTGDSLMALGCGRVFEGTMDQMWTSLSKLAALPDDTLIYSGHEYTLANARFAATIEPDNSDLQARIQLVEALRAADKPSVPVALSEEKATNPFLRAGLNSVKSFLNMDGASDSAVFSEIRKRKDAF